MDADKPAAASLLLADSTDGAGPAAAAATAVAAADTTSSIVAAAAAAACAIQLLVYLFLSVELLVDVGLPVSASLMVGKAGCSPCPTALLNIHRLKRDVTILGVTCYT
jgi:hypothetical protein